MLLYEKLKRELMKKPVWKKSELHSFLGRRYSVEKHESKKLLNELQSLGVPVHKVRLHRHTAYVIGHDKNYLNTNKYKLRMLKDMYGKKRVRK